MGMCYECDHIVGGVLVGEFLICKLCHCEIKMEGSA